MSVNNIDKTENKDNSHLKSYFYKSWGNSDNIKKHNTNEYDHAHFSMISEWDENKFPLLSKTNVKFVELNSGDMLLIPKGWWHWIRSDKSIAVNYWWENSVSIKYKPALLLEFNLNPLNINKFYNNSVTVWSSDNNSKYNTQLKDFLENDKDYSYIITLSHSSINNNHFLREAIPDPPSNFNISMNNLQRNLWISSGIHDTGLHYDDFDGLLCVYSGKKTIALFPPEDTPYLYQISIIPKYAEGFTENAFESNMYLKGKEIPRQLKMSRLLYETMLSVNAPKSVHQVPSKLYNELSEWRNRIVYGVKLENNNIRWEFYFYNISEDRANFSDTSLFVKKDPFQCSILNHFNGLQYLTQSSTIYSIDVYNKDHSVIGHDLHLYDANNKNIRTGTKFSKKDNKPLLESEFAWCTKDSMNEVTKLLNKNNLFQDYEKLTEIINKYVCKNVFVFLKFIDNKYYWLILWCGISIYDYINFLKDKNWPSSYIDFCIKNNKEIEYLEHEIGEVYDNNFEFIRSAFYGIF